MWKLGPWYLQKGFLGKSDKMAGFGSVFCWEWELLLGVVKGHVK